MHTERGDNIRIIRSGKIIASYPDDEPYPSFLMLGFENDTPIHSVIARNERTGDCYVITVYFPKADIWQAGFEKRRES